jgi:uncharacterized membrane protein
VLYPASWFVKMKTTTILGMKTAPGAAKGLRFRVDLRGGRRYGARKDTAELANSRRLCGTVMNFVHIHLLLNHLPVIGSIIGFGLFLISLFGKNDDLRRGSLIVFAATALIAIPAFASGKGAQLMLQGKPGISDAFVQRHEGAAMLALWFLEVTGAFALAGLWQFHSRARMARWNLPAVLIFSLLTVGLVVRTGNTGGEIRHTEVRASQESTPTEGTVGLIVHLIEPTPWKFTEAMTYNKWWWAFMMDLHFLGLVLLIGAVGALDLRIMGFARQLPLEPLHGLVPWALGGFGINVVTGLLAFIGMPEFYTLDYAFWVKLLAILLLGVNAAAFYLTGAFGGVKDLGPGEDAPLSAKLVAASSLILWFAVIILGRYIQYYQDSIPFGQ